MYKIGAIGKKEKIIFLRSLGIKVFYVREKADIEKGFKKIKEIGDFGIIIADDNDSDEIEKERKKLKDELPVIISLPMSSSSVKNNQKIGELENAIKRAVGTDKILIR